MTGVCFGQKKGELREGRTKDGRGSSEAKGGMGIKGEEMKMDN